MTPVDRRTLLHWLVATPALALPDLARSQGQLPIGFFASLNAQHPFWASMTQFEEAVGRDLGISSRWDYADSNQFLGYEQISRQAQAVPPMRGAVITAFKAQGERFLALVQSLKIPTITFAGVDFQKTGHPREANPYWIGAIRSNEEDVGYQLALQLLDEAFRRKLTGSDGRVHLIGISGDVTSPLARSREAGLQKAVLERKGTAVLEQIVPTNEWSATEGESKVETLLRRYPEVRVVWSANDAIALGVVRAIEKSGKRPGQDLLTGGVDWSPEALALVQNGKLVCSVGGLAFQAGWAALLMYDYLGGRDFVDDVGRVIDIPTATLTARNVGRYLHALGDGHWQKVNFSRLSRVRNPSQTRYNFSISALLALAEK